MKDLCKTRVLTGKQSEDLGRRKKQKNYSRPFKKPRGTQGPQKTSTEHDLRRH